MTELFGLSQQTPPPPTKYGVFKFLIANPTGEGVLTQESVGLFMPGTTYAIVMQGNFETQVAIPTERVISVTRVGEEDVPADHFPREDLTGTPPTAAVN